MPRFDHHCPWVGNTIGYRNHPMFLAYTISVFVCLIFSAKLQLDFLSVRKSQGESGAAVYPWVKLSIGICFFYTLFSLLLFCSQLFTTVLGNFTTNESMNRRRYAHFLDRATGMPSKKSPFDRGWMTNARMFFHFTAADEALCLQCDEPEVEMAA